MVPDIQRLCIYCRCEEKGPLSLHLHNGKISSSRNMIILYVASPNFRLFKVRTKGTMKWESFTVALIAIRKEERTKRNKRALVDMIHEAISVAHIYSLLQGLVLVVMLAKGKNYFRGVAFIVIPPSVYICSIKAPKRRSDVKRSRFILKSGWYSIMSAFAEILKARKERACCDAKVRGARTSNDECVSAISAFCCLYQYVSNC